MGIRKIGCLLAVCLMVLAVMREKPYGKDACLIGEVTAEAPGQVGLRTAIGGIRIVDMPLGNLVPRIC